MYDLVLKTSNNLNLAIHQLDNSDNNGFFLDKVFNGQAAKWAKKLDDLLKDPSFNWNELSPKSQTELNGVFQTIGGKFQRIRSGGGFKRTFLCISRTSNTQKQIEKVLKRMETSLGLNFKKIKSNPVVPQKRPSEFPKLTALAQSLISIFDRLIKNKNLPSHSEITKIAEKGQAYLAGPLCIHKEQMREDFGSVDWFFPQVYRKFDQVKDLKAKQILSDLINNLKEIHKQIAEAHSLNTEYRKAPDSVIAAKRLAQEDGFDYILSQTAHQTPIAIEDKDFEENITSSPHTLLHPS